MPWPTGSANPRTPIPKATRQRILKRDGYTCQLCQGTRCANRNLEVDHINGLSDDPSNLRTVGARPCHVERTNAQSQAARGIGAARLRPTQRHPGAA